LLGVIGKFVSLEINQVKLVENVTSSDIEQNKDVLPGV